MNTNCDPILNSPIMGYAHHLIILDDAGKPFDYEFLEINATFEKITGLKKESVIGKTVRQAIPGIEKTEFDWIGYYGKIALEGGEKEFEQYFVPLDKWYRIYVYSTEKMYFTVMFIDITESKLAEEELRKERERLINILEGTNAGTWEWNVQTGETIFNERWANIIGYTLEEISPVSIETWMKFVHPDDLKKSGEMLEKHFKGELIYYEVEARMKHKDGRWIWVLDRGKVVSFSKDGKPLWVYGTHTDITERKRAEKELLESEERFQKMLSLVPDMVTIQDADMNIVYSNWNGFAAIPEEKRVLYTKCYKTYRNYDDICPDCQAKKVLQNNEAFQEFLQLPEGLWIDMRVIPLPSQDGSAELFVEWVRDITERKRAETIQKIQYNIALSVHIANTKEELLEIIRLELGSIMDTTNFIVAIYNPEKDTLSQLIFKDEMDYCEEWSASQSLSGQVVKSGKTIFLKGDEIDTFSIQHNLEVLGTDSACWLGVPIKIQSKVAGVMIIQHYTNPNAYNSSDVALLEMIAHETGIFIEKHQMIDEIVKAKEKAEESDQLKTAFLQNMSHEIRTPLNGILGFSKLLNEEEITKEEIKEYTDIILQSGKRLMETVGNILDISKIDTGQIEVINSMFSVNSLMSEMHSLFSLSASSANLELNYHNFLENENSMISSDEMKLNQIMANLINNAIKFTQNGRIDYGYRIRANDIEFYVKDTGVGIPDEFQHRIFTRFAQVDLSVTRGYEGAGLGLSICKGLVEMLGGKMWFESEQGKGTTFYFTIPYYPLVSEVNENKKIINEIKISKKIKILIAEDDYTSFMYLSKVLKKSEFILIQAENGKEAVEIIKSNPDINLILMDIRMPVMDGFEATKIIKTIRPDLPIIAQTAYAFSSEIDKILAIGCDDYLSKPIDVNILMRIIEKYI